MPFPEVPLPAPPVTGNGRSGEAGHAVGEGGAAPGDAPTSSNHALG